MNEFLFIFFFWVFFEIVKIILKNIKYLFPVVVISMNEKLNEMKKNSLRTEKEENWNKKNIQFYWLEDDTNLLGTKRLNVNGKWWNWMGGNIDFSSIRSNWLGRKEGRKEGKYRKTSDPKTWLIPSLNTQQNFYLLKNTTQ